MKRTSVNTTTEVPIKKKATELADVTAELEIGRVDNVEQEETEKNQVSCRKERSERNLGKCTGRLSRGSNGKQR